MADEQEEMLRYLRQDAVAMAAALDITVEQAEAFFRQEGASAECLSDSDVARLVNNVNATIQAAERRASGGLHQLSETILMFAGRLVDFLSPSREAVALGPIGSMVDTVKEVPLPAPLQAVIPWLNLHNLEVYRAGEVEGGTRYGIRVVPRVSVSESGNRLRATLSLSGGRSATILLTSRHTARLFSGAFPDDWAELSLELCAEDEHERKLSAARPTTAS